MRPQHVPFRTEHLSASRPLLALGALVLCGSVVGCKAFQSVTSGAENLAANVLLPIPQEIALGNKLAAEVEKDAKLHASDDVQEYVRRVGAKIAHAAAGQTPTGIKFTYKVIDDDKTVNAFALPGGHIYVYTGLLKLASDEAELASVLAHETAHVTKRHAAERLIAANGLDAITQVALGKNPGLLGKLASQLASTGVLLKYSRDQESEADAAGMPYAVGAGYDPGGFVRLFAKIAKGDGPAFLAILQSHPPSAERTQAARQRIAAMKSPPTTTNEAAYEAMLKKL